MSQNASADADDRGAYKAIPTTDEAQTPEGGEAVPPRTCRQLLQDFIVDNNAFQSLISCVIMANAALIGLETDYPEKEHMWEFFENSFLLIFTFELLVRLYVLRKEFFLVDTKSNVFDLFIVISGIFNYIVCALYPDARKSKLSAVLRIFRLLRIMRLFRLFKMFKQLYLLATGMVESTSAVFWVSVLCCIFLYVCAIFLTKTIGRGALDHLADEELEGILKDRYGTVPRSMFSLFELMANPEVGELRTLMLQEPAVLIFFITFIITGSFAMLSILTGVISESMIERGNNHKEEMRFEEERKKQKFINDIKKIFQESDVDGDGTLTRSEFCANLPQLVTMFTEQGLNYKEQDMEMVFDLVDFDNGGTIELGEFLDGMTSFTANVSDLPLQMLQLKSKLFRFMQDMNAKRSGELDAKIEAIMQRIDGIETRIQANKL